MNVLIIGCGFVGSAVGQYLLRAGHTVTGTTTSQCRVEDIRTLGIKPAIVNVADENKLHSVVRGHDSVILCVAPRQRGDDYRNTYLLAAGNLNTAIMGTRVKQIIYTGSTRVYGQHDGSWVDEGSPVEPLDENGRILVETESTLLYRAKESSNDPPFTVTVLRLGGIYGGRRDNIGFVLAQAGTQRTDGDMYINRIHLDDIVAAIAGLIDRPFHGVLNLCDDRPQTKRSFYDAILNAAHLQPIEWEGLSTSKSRGKRVRNSKIKEVLGITLRHPHRIV